MSEYYKNQAISYIESMQKEHDKEIQKMKDESSFDPIKNLKPYLLKSLHIEKRTDSSYYSTSSTLQMYWSSKDEKLTNIVTGVLGVESELSVNDRNFGYGNTGIRFTISLANEKHVKKLYEVIDKVYEIDVVTDVENKKLSEENREMLSNLLGLIKSLGFRDSHQGYKTNRSRNKTTIYRAFPSELREQLPQLGTSPKSLADDLKKKVERAFDACLAEERERIAKAEKEKAERKANAELAKMVVKYGLDEEDDWDWGSIEEEILDKCKYLRLASAMEDTRNDWNEGFGRVKYALGRFSIENDFDQLAYDDISERAYCEETDGRIFRDTMYSYDVLYGKVDDDLLEDFELVRSKMDRYY